MVNSSSLEEPWNLATSTSMPRSPHAKAIASVEKPSQQLLVLKKCVRNNLSVRQAEELVRSMAERKRKPECPAEEEYPESYTRLVEYLEKFFSEDINIKRGKNGGGKIVIGFDNDGDIERFIDRFSKKN